jgi:hypothetical protein
MSVFNYTFDGQYRPPKSPAPQQTEKERDETANETLKKLYPELHQEEK